MKRITFVFLSLVIGLSSAYLIKVPTKSTEPKIASVGWVHIQKLMLPLFENVCEESTNEVVIRLSQEFKIDSTTGAYTKPDVVDNLRTLKTSKGLLPKGEIFTEYNTSHMNEVKTLYEVLFYADDFDTFFMAACWARQNVNCGIFVDAIYLAILNRRDTSKISVPAPYELIPNYFIPKDIIFKASSLLSGEYVTDADDAKVENNAYILDANYTIEVNDDNEDSKLAYFREDIGLNSYYFLRKLRNAPWFNTPSNLNNKYGEYMFMMMKQFAARYDLERYSNGLPELESFDWDSVITAYDPMLIYSNGNEFGHRKFSSVVGDSDDLNYLKTVENNLATIVGHLRQAGHNKTQILNHLIEIMVTSDKNYESIARQLLGYDGEVNKSQYSTLEHYMTSVRDPIFWKINKEIVGLINNALKILPGYSRTELYFPGVEVLNVETKKMMTTFESFQFDVTDSLRTVNKNSTFQVKIAQVRLDHKPFTMKLNVSSLVSQKSLIKIFLGPKTKPGQFALRKNSFVLMDKFEYSLKRGSNVISRSSEEMKSFAKDFMSLRAIRKKVEDAEFGLDALPLADIESQVGYPSRLVLPKGLPEGLLLQLFVFVAPFTKNNLGSSYMSGNMDYNTAVLSPGYPLDLDIEEKLLFNLPNALVKDIVITHKGEATTTGYSGKTGPNKWNSSNSYDSKRFDYSAKEENRYKTIDDADEENVDKILDETHNLLEERPSFTFKNKDNKDYSNKINQYKYKENNKSNQDYNRNVDFQVRDKNTAFEETDTDNDYDKEGRKTKSMLNEMGEIIESGKYDNTHYLLGDRPAFTYRNKGYDSLSNNNKFSDKEYGPKNHANATDIAYSNTRITKNNGGDENNVGKTHELLSSALRYFQKKDNLTTDDGNVNQKVEKELYTDHSKYGNKYSNINKTFQRKQTYEMVTNGIEALTDRPYDKVHGLLGAQPDFTYKKDRVDYSAKRNQYKDKKEQYSKKRTEYTKGDLGIQNKEDSFDFSKRTEIPIDLKSKDYTKIFFIDDNNNIVIKNVTENKNVYSDKSNAAKYDVIVKEIIEKPVTKRNNLMEKEIVQYPTGLEDIVVHDNYVDNFYESTVYDPVYIRKTPRKRVSVYDYLIPYHFNEEVYE